MTIEGIDISHPDKMLFPEADISKLDMIRYYVKVADRMLPYLKDRPLTLHRFPDGIAASGFYQKNTADYFPRFIKRVNVATEKGQNTQMVCNSKKALIYLANQGTIGFHSWLSQTDKLQFPNKVVFDLDPSSNQFEAVKEAATITGKFLQQQGKTPHYMTTGQHGIHVWYPIRRTKSFDELRPQLKELAETMEAKHPDLFTTAIRKNQREGKIFIDYMRNAYAQTSVCPYSLRPNKKAGIATPISLEELRTLKSADAFNLADHKK